MFRVRRSEAERLGDIDIGDPKENGGFPAELLTSFLLPLQANRRLNGRALPAMLLIAMQGGSQRAVSMW